MRLPFLFLVPLLLASSGFTLAGGRGPARLVIMPGDMLMPPNASQPLKAAISYLGGFANPGAQRNVSAAVAWSSSDKAIATVDSKGIVTSASQTGAVVITARAGPLLAKVPLTVSTATLSGISVSPGTVVLPLGRRQQLMATGSYSDATQHDLTTAVAWNSDAAAVATVNGFGAVATHSKGGANISAGFGGKSGSASLMVTDAVLDLVVLSPANPVIVYPPWLQLTASGVYSDGSTQDLTASVTWTSAAPTTASISSSGLATSIDPGTSTITATLGTKSGNALLTVMTEPVGSVTSVSNISCAAGGVSGGSCYSLNVSCPAVADQNV